MENLKTFIESDGAEAQSNNDYTPFIQSQVNSIMSRCAENTQWSLEEKDTAHENFGWFANCVRNNVFKSPALNQNRSARFHLAGAEY